MANQTGRPVAPARKLVAAVLGTIAVFIMVFGLGLSSWPIVALGAALLALSIALGMVNVVRRGARAWVAGTGQVKAISEPPLAGAYGRAELQLTVVAPGLPINDVLVRESRVPVGKWPQLGDTLPISVDVDDMRRVRILWDEAGERADDGDPPPPAYEPADEFIDDDLLGDPEPPPWAARDRSWGRGPDEPPPPPPPGADPDLLTSPIVVRDTPGGPVLEGQFVDLDSNPQPLPQRARTARGRNAGPDPVPTPRTAEPDEVPPASAADPTAADPTAADPDRVDASARSAATQGRTPGARPSPRPRPAGSTQTQTDEGTPHHSPEAAPTPADPPGPVVPGQRAAAPPGGAGAAAAPAAAPTVTDPQEHDIDLPLDGDPEAAPEFTAHSADAVDHDLIAPPADSPPPAAEPTDLPSPAAEPGDPPSPAAERADSPSPAAEPGAPPSPAAEPAGPPAPAAEAIDPADAAPASGPGDGPTITGLDTPSVPAGQEPTGAAQTTPPGAAAEQPPTGHAFAGATAAERPAAADDRTGDDRTADDRTADDRTAGSTGAERPAAADDRTADDRTAGSTAAERPTDDPERSDAGDDASRKSGFATAATIAGAAFTGFALGAAARHHGTEPPPSEGPATDDDRSARPWADLEGGYEPADRTDDVITAYPSARPGPAGAIHGVGITVLVTDLPRSIAFYRDTLGFFEIDNGPGSAVLASGDTRLVLRAVQSLSADLGRLIHLNLEVGDVDAVYEELRAKGVTFEHAPRPVNRGGRLELWAATFYDPDGHNIAITQWRAVHDG